MVATHGEDLRRWLVGIQHPDVETADCFSIHVVPEGQAVVGYFGIDRDHLGTQNSVVPWSVGRTGFNVGIRTW